MRSVWRMHRGGMQRLDVLGQSEDGPDRDAGSFGDVLCRGTRISRVDQVEHRVDGAIEGVDPASAPPVHHVFGLRHVWERRHHRPVVSIGRRTVNRSPAGSALGLRLSYSAASIRSTSSSSSSISRTSRVEPGRHAVGDEQPLRVVGADRRCGTQLPGGQFDLPARPAASRARGPAPLRVRRARPVSAGLAGSPGGRVLRPPRPVAHLTAPSPATASRAGPRALTKATGYGSSGNHSSIGARALRRSPPAASARRPARRPG